MVPHQNTRSHHQPQTAPLPPTTRTRAAATGDPTGIPKLPPELRSMIWKASTKDSKYSDLKLAIRPKKRRRAPKTELWLLNGHPLSQISYLLCREADENYPFEIIRENEGEMTVQIDISSRNKHHSLWGICTALSAQGIYDKIMQVEITGWTCISFRALVHLIIDCGCIPHIRGRVSTTGFGWSRCYANDVYKLLRAFDTDVTKHGRHIVGINNVPYVSGKLWTYLNPPKDPPVGVPAAAPEQWDTRKQIRAWMNTGFHVSRNADEALRKS
jgi:hypothetical protein